MARMSIYVPDELKERMDAVDSVNWSAVAQSQFERELRLHPKLTGDEMQATIERLKASKVAQTDEVIAAGVEAGKQWAMKEAEYLDLLKIGEQLKREFAVKVTQEDPITGGLKDALRSFPIFLPESTMNGEYYEHGFCLGVLEVWNQVKDHLA
jgi:hypothetical protein